MTCSYCCLALAASPRAATARQTTATPPGDKDCGLVSAAVKPPFARGSAGAGEAA
jgi:hypothetical protein